MKRTSLILKAAGLAALALVAYFLMRPPGAVEDRIILEGGGPGSAAFVPDTTLRNVLGRDIAYTIRPGPRRRAPVERTLEDGDVDRISTGRPVEIEFDNGSRKGTYTLYPGKPYSFRFDAQGVVKVYPGAHGRADAADLAPFVPTPPPVVDRMLELADVARGDVVYDIGCGDGRLVIAAARTYGARGVGIEIDEGLVEEARQRAREEGVAGLVRFVRMDGTKAHVREATVVALYLLPESLETLKPLFEKELRPGTRIVSHDYRIPGWDDRITREEVMIGERDRSHRIIVYVMPAGR